MTQPANGTAAVAGGGTGVSYTPAADYCGADSFTYALAGGSTATVSVTVTCVDDPAPPPPPDTTPPNTTITKKPKGRIVIRGAKASVQFKHSSSESPPRFECKMDGAAFASCGPAKSYRLAPGTHRFQVRALDAAGNRDASPAKFTVKVIRKRR